MAKLSNKYEKMIEFEDKKFYRNLKAKKKAKKKKKPNNKIGTKERPFIPYKKQLLDSRWKKRRQQVFKWKGRACEKCGATTNLQVHHLRYVDGKYAWEYKMKDLMVLCGGCHEKMHGIDLDKRMDELIDNSYDT